MFKKTRHSSEASKPQKGNVVDFLVSGCFVIGLKSDPLHSTRWDFGYTSTAVVDTEQAFHLEPTARGTD